MDILVTGVNSTMKFGCNIPRKKFKRNAMSVGVRIDI